LSAARVSPHDEVCQAGVICAFEFDGIWAEMRQ